MVRGMVTRQCLFERFATAIVVLIALPTCLVFAQTSAATATILGVVKDTTGALIPGVSITVKHTETGLTRAAISGETGDYNVPLLPVGAYEIATTMPGFKQQVRSGINLSVVFTSGAASVTVTVSPAAPTSSVRLITACWPTARLMPLLTCCLKPGIAVVISYAPIGSNGTL